MPMLVGKLMHHEVRDLFEGDLRRILAAPVCERRAGCLRIFETRDVVAGSTGEFRDRLLADVVEQRGLPISRGHAQQHLLVALNLGLIGTEAVGENLLRAGGREAVLEIHQGQFVEGLPFFTGQRLGCRDLRGLPVLRGPEQIRRGIRGGITHFAVRQRHRLEQHVWHQCPRVIAGRLAEPAVEPRRPTRIRSHLGTDPRQVGTVRARRLGEVGVLMAGQAATHLHHLLTSLDIGGSGDPGIRLHIFKRLARTLHVRDHRADFERLVSHRFLETLALEMLPETEEPRHLRGRTEVLRVPQPCVEPVKADLAGNVPQRWANLGQRARRLWILEERGELMAAGRQLGIGPRGCVAFDHVAEPFPRLTAVRTRPHVLHPARGGGAE